MAKCAMSGCTAEALDCYAVCSEHWREWRAKEFAASDGLPECEGRKRGLVPQSHPSRHRLPKATAQETNGGE
jgi:hypothetical protein